MKLVMIKLVRHGKDPSIDYFLIKETLAKTLDEYDPMKTLDEPDFISPLFRSSVKCKKWAKDKKHTIEYTMEAPGY